jgi:hypothetical protein
MGAGGHTGSFVVAELRRRGMTPIPCGRATDLDLALGVQTRRLTVPGRSRPRPRR